jgi:hypothetical protein
MIDWEEVLNAQSDEELKKAKLWLFQENIRLEKEKEELVRVQDKFLLERAEFREELEMMSLKTMAENKRLKEESLFFEKKMEILKNGFQMLENDRKSFEQEKNRFENRNKDPYRDDVAGRLFESTNGSPFAVRKRYRDLVKIFHPDNLCGDASLIQAINEEYQRFLDEETISDAKA